MKKQGDPLAPTKLTMRVMPNDLDPYFHVNNGRYLTLMDLGRVHLLWVTGLLKAQRKKKWAPILGGAKIHFIRPLNLFNKFTMTTQTIYWDEKWFYLEQKIFKKDELCAVALFKILFYGKQGKVPPDDLIALLPHPVTKPLMPHYLRAWLEAEKEKISS
jgi:acyl-CoA thioesterase FadM